MISVRVHEKAIVVNGNKIAERVAALCDEELLGKVLEDGDLCLDLEKHAGFYKGAIVSEADAAKLLEGASSVNAVGEKSVAAVRKAFGKAGGIIKIAGVPHLQVYRL
ncbi:MAG: DUF424 domain-containing protein [Candidatus Micrarchaeia archaeon]|jgi:hypothetical protein